MKTIATKSSSGKSARAAAGGPSSERRRRTAPRSIAERPITLRPEPEAHSAANDACPSEVNNATTMIPRIGITAARARAIATWSQRLDGPDFLEEMRESAVVLHEEFDFLVAHFMRGEFAGDVVAVQYESSAAPQTPNAYELTVRDLGTIRGGIYYDPIDYAESFATNADTIQKIARIKVTA